MTTSILLKSSVSAHIISYCTAKKPNEACGFLFGTADSSSIQIEAFEPVPNNAVNPCDHFSMDPMRMIQLLLRSPYQGLQVVGILHSHPCAAAIPSHEDLLTSWHNLPSHWIVSLQQPEIYMVAYHYVHTMNSTIPPTLGSHYLPLPITLID
jgi:proteasome lid subunit RPN8/RPN11